MQSFLVLLHGMDLGWNLWSFVAVGSDLLALLTAPSVLLRRSGRPTAALGWILALFTLPALGPALWWMIGRSRVERRSADRCRSRATLAATTSAAEGVLDCCTPAGSPGVSPRRHGTSAALLVDAAQAYPAFEAAIGAARQSIEVMFYIWQPDGAGARLRDRLAARAAAGIDVRVLVDGFGARRADRRFFAPLIERGGRVAWFRPPHLLRRGFDLNFRNHRKLLLIDHGRAWIGGLNVGDEHLSEWHDLAVELDGPVVRDLFEVFADDWFFTTGEELPLPAPRAGTGAATVRALASGPDVTVNATRDAFFIALTSARVQIRLMTPYFIPDEAILQALRTAALQGVDVRLLLPSSATTAHERLTLRAARTWFPELLDAGVRIWEYEGGFLHAKALVVDDDLVLLGSANLDTRSFRLNFELSTVIRDPGLAAAVTEVFRADLDRSREVVRAALERRSFGARLVDASLRLGSPLL